MDKNAGREANAAGDKAKGNINCWVTTFHQNSFSGPRHRLSNRLEVYGISLLQIYSSFSVLMIKVEIVV